MEKAHSNKVQLLLQKSWRKFAGTTVFLICAGTLMANYTATISPTNITLNTPTAITLTVTSFVNNLGAIQIAIPSGVTGPASAAGVTLSPPAGKTWNVTSVSSGSISLVAAGNGNQNRLGNGQSISIMFTITITTPGSKIFTTQAFTTQNGTGNGVGSFIGDQPTINPTPGCPAAGAVLYVNAAVATSGTGGTWDCAFKELSDAIVVANANPAIKAVWVAAGTYKPTDGSDRSETLLITRGDLKILGGFASGAVNEAAANPVANPTIISGDIGALGDATDNSYHLVSILNLPAASPVIIDGFAFTAGNASAAGTTGGSGGAIIAMNNSNATMISVSRSLFGQNRSSLYGGAVFTYMSNMTISSSIFLANTSTYGGGMFGWFSSPVISKTVFSGNTAVSGGGYYGNFGYPTNSTPVTISSSIFSNNMASGEGGAVYQNQANFNYLNCLFNANSSEYSGAIHQHNASASTVVNSTFYNNSATNTSSFGAGAIMLAYNNCTTNVSNSIFYKNKNKGADNVPAADIKNSFGTINVVSNSMLQTGTTMNVGPANMVGVNPMFVNEANPLGGDAVFFTADDGLALMSGSPAYNAGSGAPVAIYGLTMDMLGNPRTACGNVDMGAIEIQACTGREVSQQVSRSIEHVPSGIVANPFNNDLQVKYTGEEQASLRVIDLSGKPQYNNGSIRQGVTHIDASGWTKGMYQVVITTVSGKQMVFKAMKL